MPRFAQLTRLTSTTGNADKLADKFLELSDLQRDNDDCQLVVVATSETEPDVVYGTEVWADEHAWKEARRSKAVADWAKKASSLVAQWPPSIRLTNVSGKGVA